MERRKRSLLLVFALIGLVAEQITGARAGPLRREQTPEPLRPWVDWVLYGNEKARCPFFLGNEEERRCVWPSRLVLELGDSGGRFTQRWLAFSEEWVPLPGDESTWPQDVRLDGAAAAAVPREGRPGVLLKEGAHVLAGTFEWKMLPPVLQVPTETGLLRLTLRGREVPFPGRDAEGRLWLQKLPGADEGESSVDISVNRRVTDDIPLVLTTRVTLQISGESREALLGRALPERFVPMSLASPLPARLDADGRLRVQFRPGQWTIEIAARHEGPARELSPPQPEGPWSAEEVWVFDARPDLRLVSVEGVAAVDPQQTTLPDDWKPLPAYLLRPGDAIRLVEKRRGDSEPAPDRLSLERTWWLDFDGGGYSIRDRIGGVMDRNWRLDMLPPAVLGRVAVNGADQFITRRGPTAPAGVELRQGRVTLEADSRLTGRSRTMPAVGWDEDFESVSGRLKLPPGWRLFHASGVDDVSATWISSWTLLDLFLVFIAALTVARLWGWAWGAVALVTLILTWIEVGAPRWILLLVLVGETLTRVLPAGKPLRLVRLLHWLAIAGLILVTVPFMLRQVRMALHPALEYGELYAGGARSGGIAEIHLDDYETAGGFLAPILFERRVPPPPLAPPMVTLRVAPSGEAQRAAPEGTPAGSLGYVQEEGTSLKYARPSFDYRRFVSTPDLSTVVQTGPGLPDWSWRLVLLNWRGPVTREQTIHFFLIPPGANFILVFLRVGLLALLAACLMGARNSPRLSSLLGRAGLSSRTAGAPVVAALILLGAGALPARAEIPEQSLLEELQKRLLASPECSPQCASSPRLVLEVSPTVLRARQEIHAAAPTAVPLPGAIDQWFPREVLVDGKPAAGLLLASGQLWLQVATGTHQVLMEGPLPDRDAVQLPLPLKPHRTAVRASGWRIDGLGEDGEADESLQLTRLRAGDRQGSTLEPGILPPFVRVERELRLGLEWQAATRVARMSPPGVSVLLEVPLLAGESVTTPGIRVERGMALVTLGPQAAEIGWESTLSERPVIELAAPREVSWVEVWRLVAAPVWHLEPRGIPPIHRPEQEDVRVREWRPWPGESVTIDVTRPEGLGGQSLTIDSTALQVRPGLRTTDLTLQMVVRSSRGGQHAVRIPEGAVLQSVLVNGVNQPIRQEDGRVTLPIAPGRQEFALSWMQPEGIRTLLRAPRVELGAPSANAQTRVDMPVDRWTLFVGGPGMKPAVLFWTLLIVLLLVSIGLGLVRQTPLRWRHWFLLGLGLTQVPLWVAMGIAAWILTLGWRRQRGAEAGAFSFNLMQLILALWTAASLAGLFWSIQRGLLGLPEMQIAGNGSTSLNLMWYLDRTEGRLPRPWVFSIPLMAYRLAMLAWSLWLAQSLLGWLRWGWGSFTMGGLWRPFRLRWTRRSSPPLVQPAAEALE